MPPRIGRLPPCKYTHRLLSRANLPPNNGGACLNDHSSTTGNLHHLATQTGTGDNRRNRGSRRILLHLSLSSCTIPNFFQAENSLIRQHILSHLHQRNRPRLIPNSAAFPLNLHLCHYRPPGGIDHSSTCLLPYFSLCPAPFLMTTCIISDSTSRVKDPVIKSILKGARLDSKPQPFKSKNNTAQNERYLHTISTPLHRTTRHHLKQVQRGLVISTLPSPASTATALPAAQPHSSKISAACRAHR